MKKHPAWLLVLTPIILLVSLKISYPSRTTEILLERFSRSNLSEPLIYHDPPSISAPSVSALDAPAFDAPAFDAAEFDAPEFDAAEFDAPMTDSSLPLLSLCPDGLSFCADDAPVVLRGANLANLIFADTPVYLGSLDLFKEDARIVQSWGSNFAVISYDPERAYNYDYAQKIVEAVEYTRSLGLFVELMQHHATINLPASDVIHLLVQDEDPAEFTTDVWRRWMALLSHQGFAERLGRSVDIFGIYSEPSDIPWKKWRPRAEKVCRDIRSVIRREAVCSISGVRWGWDLRGLAGDPFQTPSVVAEVHNYKGHEFLLSRARNWEQFIGKVPLLVGEFGYTDPPEYITRLLAFLRENNISWAAWPGGPLLWSEVPTLDNLLREELAHASSS